MAASLPSICIYVPTERIRLAVRDAFDIRFETGRSISDAIPVLLSEPIASKQIAILGPAIGAPAAALLCHAVARTENATLLVPSVAGTLDPETADLGDILFPRGAISNEGTSPHYGAASPFAMTSPQSSLEEIITASASRCSTGVLISMDAPYCETETWLDTALQQGATAVDMEYSALLHLSNVLHFKLAAAFVISDCVVQPRRRDFTSPTFRASLHTVAKAVAALALTS